VGSFSLRPGDSLTAPRAALSVGFIRFVSSTDATQATGLLTPAPAGLSPTEHASLRWTHCVAKISEQYLLPVLQAMLHQFPFLVLGFHSDNGSEFVNHTVAKLLNKLLVAFTRSRPNRSSDNALVEGKNGAIIRKHIGYGHIASQHADPIQRFYTAHFNPYLNYHRPCGFAQVLCDERGRRRRRYRAEHYATPYEKLHSLPQAHRYLKDGLRWELLDHFAYALSDTEAARRMMRAKAELLCSCKLESPFPPRFVC
jgi:transposase InsO family protein